MIDFLGYSDLTSVGGVVECTGVEAIIYYCSSVDYGVFVVVVVVELLGAVESVAGGTAFAEAVAAAARLIRFLLWNY